MNGRVVLALGFLVAFQTWGDAQETDGHAQMQMGRQEEPGATVRMVMPTNNAKVFRLVRSAVGALQVSLAQRGHFAGRITGLFGPSTRTALAAFQRNRGETDSGMPTLATTLALMGFDGASLVAEYRDRISVSAPPAMEGGMGEMGGTAAPGATVAGDPAGPKSPMAMEMPGMRLRESDHTEALRSFRQFVAALQIKLAEVGRYEGPIDGRPGGAVLRGALRAYQEEKGLAPSGELDLPTALSLFGQEQEVVLELYQDRIDLEYSPVAMDRELMRRSMRRRMPSTSSRQDGRDANDLTEQTRCRTRP